MVTMPNTITLSSETEAIKYLCQKDKCLAKVISSIGPINYQPYEDEYAFLVHEIIEQMLSVKAGAKIYERLETLCEGNIAPDIINSLSDEEIRNIGTSSAKVSYIRSLTQAVNSGTLDFQSLPSMTDSEIMKALTSVKGIGKWTAKMYLIFVLNRQDILPTEDVAFLQAYLWLYKTENRNPENIQRKCKKWKPYSSIAARYLYRALDTGLTKEEFHLYK